MWCFRVCLCHICFFCISSILSQFSLCNIPISLCLTPQPPSRTVTLGLQGSPLAPTQILSPWNLSLKRTDNSSWIDSNSTPVKWWVVSCNLDLRSWSCCLLSKFGSSVFPLILWAILAINYFDCQNKLSLAFLRTLISTLLWGWSWGLEVWKSPRTGPRIQGIR